MNDRSLRSIMQMKWSQRSISKMSAILVELPSVKGLRTADTELYISNCRLTRFGNKLFCCQSFLSADAHECLFYFNPKQPTCTL